MKAFHKVLSIVMDVILVCSLLFFVSICYLRTQTEQPPPIFGWSFATVISGSMEPTIPIGALVAVQEQDEYAPGDIIMYHHENGFRVTHKIINIQGQTVITQGNANNTADQPFHKDQIVGKVRLILPGVGGVVQTLRNHPVFPFVIALFIVIAFLPGLIPGKERRSFPYER